MTEQNLRHLTIKSNEVQVVHGGKIMNPGAIGHLRHKCDCPRPGQDVRRRKEERPEKIESESK